MRQQVLKYPIPMVAGRFTLGLPKGAEVLTVQEQFGQPHIWALVDPSAGVETRTFELLGTGHETPDRQLAYIDTVQLAAGALIWHAFEVLR